MRLRSMARCAAGDVYFLATPALKKVGGLYISAGIHGDEPAASEALVTWAEQHARSLRDLPLILFPCLNPWGLTQNIRLDENGIDLNRAFNTGGSAVIESLKQIIAPYQFKLALCLHEDYDAEGFYLYEVRRGKPYWGEELLERISEVIPVDSRPKIDGRVARSGLIRRRIDPALFERIGHPEAIYLHQHHSVHALTLETPSEFALERRVAAHVRAIEECFRRLRSP
ncbi:MAG: M14 family metallocarboxypeptidase [Chthoniobacteraceae bacterium]